MHKKKKTRSNGEHTPKCACKQTDTGTCINSWARVQTKALEYRQTHTDMYRWLMHVAYLYAQLKAQQIHHPMSLLKPSHDSWESSCEIRKTANGINSLCLKGKTFCPASNVYLSSFIPLICWKDGKAAERPSIL